MTIIELSISYPLFVEMVSLVRGLQILVVGGRVNAINFLSVPPGSGGDELSIGIVPSTLIFSGVDYSLLLYISTPVASTV
jgi:hypothetical protein